MSDRLSTESHGKSLPATADCMSSSSTGSKQESTLPVSEYSDTDTVDSARKRKRQKMMLVLSDDDVHMTESWSDESGWDSDEGSI